MTFIQYMTWAGIFKDYDSDFMIEVIMNASDNDMKRMFEILF